MLPAGVTHFFAVNWLIRLSRFFLAGWLAQKELAAVA